jgi:dihydrofolate reductase
VGKGSLEGLVGRQPSIPPPGFRAHPFRARTAADARRHDILFRHRWHQVGAQAGEARSEGKDVALGGGANIAQQYLASGLIDELEIHVVPILLDGGARLFDNVNYRNVKLEPIRTIVGAGVTHLKYCVLK